MIRLHDEAAPFRPWASGVITGLVAGTALAGLGLGVVTGTAGYFARLMVTPPKVGSAEDLPVRGLGFPTPSPGEHEQPTTITLPATTETRAPGRYVVFFQADRGQAQIGEVLSYSPGTDTVTRRVEKVISGSLSEAVRVRWSGAIFADPREAGYPYEEVTLTLPVGDAPAWVVPALSPHTETWAVMVHGRGAARQETLRALAATQELGMSSIHLSYRNDREAPSSADGRYGLGFTEWEDVDVAIRWALDHGARDVVLFGWSMGGAIVLQSTVKSRYRHLIRALVLDGPVVDWFELIRHHTHIYRMPLRIGQLVATLLAEPKAKLMTGLVDPIMLPDLDWLTRSDELNLPVLILHSLDDDFVPAAPSQKLAEKNPWVSFVPFTKAQHTKEWNVDPERWTGTVIRWLRPRLTAPLPD